MDSAVERLRAKGLEVDGRPADVASGEAMAGLVAFTVERFGGLDILVNNAGVGTFGSVVATSEEDWRAAMGINLDGVFNASKHAIPRMRERGGGAIVNIASVHSFATLGERIAYVTSKTALLGMTRGMALNHAAEGIRVNVVCPGPIDTPMLRRSWETMFPDADGAAVLAEQGKKLPLGRLGRPEDIAEAVAFLVGPRSAWITGIDIKVDGGLLGHAGPDAAHRTPRQLRRRGAAPVNATLKRHPFFILTLFAPATLLVGIFILWPVVNGVRLSFTDATPLRPTLAYVGLGNFTFLFGDPEFWTVLGNTLYIVGTATVIATVCGYGLAVLLNSGLRFAGFFRAAIFQVWVVPWIVIAILWGWLFSQDYGLVNYLLLQLGVTTVNLKWLFEPTAAQWAVITGYAWRAIPFIMVICLAALQGVPRDLVEQAAIDGAGFLARQRYVVLPLLRNIILVAALLQAVRFFQEMTMVFVLTQGGPVNATMVLSLYTYKTAFEDWDFGLASAVGTVWLVLLLVVALFYVRFALDRSLAGGKD